MPFIFHLILLRTLPVVVVHRGFLPVVLALAKGMWAEPLALGDLQSPEASFVSGKPTGIGLSPGVHSVDPSSSSRCRGVGVTTAALQAGGERPVGFRFTSWPCRTSHRGDPPAP